MRTLPRKAVTGLIALPLLLLTAACGVEDDPNADSAKDPSGSSTESTSGSPSAGSCAVADLNLLKPGQLTIATDSPAYEPWFIDDDPSNGKGYESAVAYALAEQLGFAKSDVKWVTVPFNNSYKPGKKDFDFDINQISITPAREKVVDFSTPYYSASQAVITLKDATTSAGSLADLAALKLGAQTGTTSLTAITEVIEPASDPLIFDDTNAAKQALLNGQVDAIVADLPTAIYITSVEIPEAEIDGQFQPDTGTAEAFGLLFDKGNPLVTCVDSAIDALTEDGTLADLEKQWIPASNVPVLK